MSTRHPVLAMSFDPKQNAVPEGDDRFAHMAQAFLADIRARVDDRPVVLAGYSFGGALAVQLAGLAADAGVTVARIINLDGGCPTAWAAPRDDAEDAPGGPEGLFNRQFQNQPCLPIDTPLHLLTTTRAFPFARGDLGTAWSHLSRVEIVEHAFDIHHAQLPKSPFATATAQCLDRILAGDMPATRRHPPRFDAQDLALLNQVKSLSHGGDLAGAISLLQAAGTDHQDHPEWRRVALVRLLRQAGRAEVLTSLQADPTAAYRTPAVLHALQRQSGQNRPALLRLCHTVSGAGQGGAILLFERFVASGQMAEAQAILAALDASPRHGVEAAIARAVQTGLRDGLDQASQQLTALLSGAEVDHTHIRWSAVFLARHGHVDAALDILELERNRFPGPMQKARAHIERNYRKLTPAPMPAPLTKPVADSPAPSGRLKRFLRGVAGR